MAVGGKVQQHLQLHVPEYQRINFIVKLSCSPIIKNFLYILIPFKEPVYQARNYIA
jgi:hypothetical protein